MANRHPITTWKAILITVSFTALWFTAISQYYYKDLVSVKQINENFRLYKQSKIAGVKLKSFQGNEPVTEGFVCEQTVDRTKNQVITYTKTADAGESFFTAFYNPAGLLIKTVDSTEESVSQSAYQYDAANRLFKLTHSTHATDSSSSSTESHTWVFTASGKPQSMQRSKNGHDSTTFNFTLDDKGNVIEEKPLSTLGATGTYYYYYDAKNQLTDIVRYNTKAKRLLPDYIFEYEDNGDLSTLTLVPEGSSDYQKWYYKYDETGIKVMDFCYNKKNELQGKIEYHYTVGR